MILERTRKLLTNQHQQLINRLTIEEVRIGLHLSAIRLSDNSIGLVSTLTELPGGNNEKKERDFDMFSPGRIRGGKVADLLDSPKNTPVMVTLKMLATSAISSKILQQSAYTIVDDTDPIDLLELGPRSSVTIVGAFPSYIRKAEQHQCRIKVLEFHQSALLPEHKQYYVPAEKFGEVIPASDVVIITGFTLLNNTIDGLLAAVTPGTKVVVTGPSGSVIPDILFESKVNIIGATRITDAPRLFQLVSEGGSGYHLFRHCARKISIINPV
ncbi:MAG: Rossmann-like domain-containing protein [Bacteroidota bacterium]